MREIKVGEAGKSTYFTSTEFFILQQPTLSCQYLKDQCARFKGIYWQSMADMG